jgi:RNA polymerase sigma factor (sigma-70 family)
MKLMLETMTEDIKVAAIASDGEEAIKMVETTAPDLILMDVRMPVMDGVEATKIIHQKHPDIKIIMLTTFLDDTYVETALQYGAYGYVLKNIKSKELIASLRAIYGGSVLFSPAILEKLIRRLDSSQNKTEQESEQDNEYQEVIGRLGNREKDILKLVAKGYSNKEIADTLFISEPTVRNYISSIYAKVGSKNRFRVISIAQKAHIEKK